MAKRKSDTKSSNKTEEASSKVVRIKASDSKSSKTKKASTSRSAKVAADKKATKKPVEKKTSANLAKKRGGWLRSFLGYFKNSWIELKQVHWPTRKATWSLTFAVLVFSGFYVLFIMLLDAGFKTLFESLLT